MAKVKEVIDLINGFAPEETQEKWDNSGWQVNLGIEECSKIMTAVTVTDDVIRQAKEKKCDLIIAHHPLIFEPLKFIEKGIITEAVKNDIQIYSAHTNLDLAKGGTTDTLSEKCGFGKCESVNGFVNYKKLNKPITVDFLVKDIKKRLQTDCIQIINPKKKKKVKSVAFCAGAGGFELNRAQELGIDLFITGEVKFHECFDAKDTVVFAVGHYESEQFAGEIFRKILGNICEIVEADEKRPYSYN